MWLLISKAMRRPIHTQMMRSSSPPTADAITDYIARFKPEFSLIRDIDPSVASSTATMKWISVDTSKPSCKYSFKVFISNKISILFR
jgi:hypothetical protein